MTGRRELDFYPTPAWQTDLLMERLWPAVTANTVQARILEPCVGSGNIVRAVQQWSPDTLWITNDINPQHEADHHLDACQLDLFDMIARPEWVITNPPFGSAFEIIRNSYECAALGVAALLRITWLEPLKTGPKAPWLRAHPPTWELIMERYSYDGSGGQDSATSAWFVWFKDTFVNQRIEVIPGRGKQAGLQL